MEILLEIHLELGRRFHLFGDAGFIVSDCIQATVKSYVGYLINAAQDYNNPMSRIRIYLENAFAGLANEFSYLAA